MKPDWSDYEEVNFQTNFVRGSISLNVNIYNNIWMYHLLFITLPSQSRPSSINTVCSSLLCDNKV